MYRLITTILVLLCITTHVSAQLNRPSPSGLKVSQPPQDQSRSAQLETTGDQRGSAKAPIIVKIPPTPKTEKKARQEQSDRDDISSANWWMVGLTGVIGFIAFVQLIVFGLQAHRLKQTIKTMEKIASGQTADMQASIRESGRAAVAMEGVAAGIAASVENTSRMAEDQRRFWRQQMRAYVFVQTANIYNVAVPPTPIPQGQQPPAGAVTLTDRGPIIVIAIRNSGHTPASNVIHYMNVVFREFPLVSNLDLHIDGADTRLLSVFSIPPGGSTTKNFVFTNKLTDDEVSQLRGNTAAIFIYGRITYTDIFGIDRITNYRFRHNAHTGIIGMVGEVTGTEQGNDST